MTDILTVSDLTVAFPGGESGNDVVARYAAQLAAIADEHRGETVLVIAHQTAAAITISTMAGNVPASFGDGE